MSSKLAVLVVYFSHGGHTRAMAEAVAKGAGDADATVHLREVCDLKVDDLELYDAILVGTPVYYGAMAAEIKKLLDDTIVLQGKLADKVGGVFVSCGRAGGGAEITALAVICAMFVHGMVVPGGSQYCPLGPVSLHAFAGADINKDCERYGATVARLAAALQSRPD